MIFPSEYLIDYVRVYQRKDQVNIGCDPQEFPTAKYINDHLEAYMGEFFFFFGCGFEKVDFFVVL